MKGCICWWKEFWDKPCLIRPIKKPPHIKLMLKQMAQIVTILLCTVLKHKNFFTKYLIIFLKINSVSLLNITVTPFRIVSTCKFNEWPRASVFTVTSLAVSQQHFNHSSIYVGWSPEKEWGIRCNANGSWNTSALVSVFTSINDSTSTSLVVCIKEWLTVHVTLQ
jgi:hypothetical protein